MRVASFENQVMNVQGWSLRKAKAEVQLNGGVGPWSRLACPNDKAGRAGPGTMDEGPSCNFLTKRLRINIKLYWSQLVKNGRRPPSCGRGTTWNRRGYGP